MKLTSNLLIGLAALALAASCTAPVKSTVPASIKDGKIVFETPAREKGQESALLMTADPIENIRIGFIGLGMRGKDGVHRYTYLDGVTIVALCDLIPENVEKTQAILAERGLPQAEEYVGEEAWKKLCERDDIDLVYICTDWVNHVPMAVYAMEKGKHVAVEVPAAMSLSECWQLVNTCEKTRKHCMMLENCVYDFFEATTLNMAQQGLFGEVYYAEGGYIHNLDPFWTRYQGNWRLEYNRKFRGENYPTHGIGPICQVFNIHRGDLFDYVVSMDTKSYHGAEVAKEIMDVDEFANGDHTTSLIRTVNGKIINIQHNVYGSRPYSRLHSLTGSKGFATKYPKQQLCVRGDKIEQNVENVNYDKLDGERFVPQEVFDALMEQYKPDFVREIEDKAREVGGHGGMDFIMDYRLVYCLHNGLPLDQDVYDAAEWCCLTELSRISIENGSMPVKVPDFTRGDWNKINGYSYAFAE